MATFEPSGRDRQFAVRGLSVGFRTPAGVVPVVSGVDLTATPGRITGIAGESGSGKTTAVLAAIGYLPGAAVRLGGDSSLGDTSILALDRDARRRVWATRISYVAQDAAGSLNPAFRIGAQLREVLEANGGLDRERARARARELLAAVHLPDPEAMLRRYPHQCSGGQLQRVAIAMAIACEPELVIFDEPTTGLDVTTQAEVVGMLTDLIRSRGMAAVYISHDLALLGAVADELVIFYAGEVVERGPMAEILRSPRHPYTRALLDALPSAKRATVPVGLPGFPPGRVVADACPFALRCAWAVDRCRGHHPDLLPVRNASHLVRCFRASEIAAALARVGPLGNGNALAVASATHPILALRHVRCAYGKGASRFEAVKDVSLEIGPGEVVALVGESGSGKSTIGRAIVGLLPFTGEIVLDGVPLDPAGRRTRDQARAIQLVFQNPDASLNPRQTVETLIGRAVELFRTDVPRGERRATVAEALAEVRLDPELMPRYPHQLSGGQKQRVAIARAFVARPKLVICDEIVSGQDVSVQAAILELVRAMQERHGTALLFISHDLAVVRSIAQRVAVIRHGALVESGSTPRVFDQPQAEYSRSLLESVLEPHNHVLAIGTSEEDRE
jgi:peptide/nickel transport system ATP-binding protein